jgi:putative hydrolase of HD superfamily
MPLNQLTSDFILSEVAKLQYLYGLKNEIRYADTRHETDSTESVAEHIYGMHILCQYFLPLEDSESNWDKLKILEMITLHDIDEIETGDVIGYTKTKEMLEAEGDAMRTVMRNSPLHMQTHMTKLIDEYEAQVSPESRFVKAIDRFEPQIHLFNAKGKAILQYHKTTREQNMSLRETKLKPYPYLYTYYQTIENVMYTKGYFHTE